MFRFSIIALLSLGLPSSARPVVAEESDSTTTISYQREIRPILARHCFACHGPDDDARQADLRLDRRDAAIAAGAIDPNDFAASELLKRISTSDPDERMPPADSGRSLSVRQQDALAKWIGSGAKYERHWAFERPRSPPVPAFTGSWARTPIDAFVLARMQAAGFSPNAEANRFTLVRRLYLDLIGLVPSQEEVDAFIRDESGNAYEKLVSRLLASPHYGERWARVWLDLARYSDTNGYEKDRPRSIWPYRDWVIQALNEEMPFNQFTIEQIAGDMLTNATAAQRTATGFHRNTMLNEEGGIDPLEYRFYAMVDRVATTGTVWLGLSVGCAQCHSHKYDPISHSDYYRMLALLNNADEPELELNSLPRSETIRIEAKIDQLESDLPHQFPVEVGADEETSNQVFQEAFDRWCDEQQPLLAPWTVAHPTKYTTNLPHLERLNDDSLFASGDFTKRDEYHISLELPANQRITAIRLEALPDSRLPARGPGRAYYEGRKGDFFLSEIDVKANGHPLKFASGSRSYGKIAVGSGNAEAVNVFDEDGSTGWSTAEREGERHTLILRLAQPITTRSFDVSMLFERHFVAGLGRFRFSVTDSEGDIRALPLEAEVENVLSRDRQTWDEHEREIAVLAFVRSAPELAEARRPIDALRRQLATRKTTMVMQERPAENPRTTFRHHRGEWLSPREKVSAGLPSLFDEPSAAGLTNRLEFANWLVSDANPLAARVVVNRAWRHLMGFGLVRSDGDFGTQSSLPTHPELLDWLASSFVREGWSLKRLHQMIVMSATYRQNSSPPAGQVNEDAANLYFSRGPRHRVDAETVRDVMLSASGLLSTTIGGPSVRPPQPASVTAIAYGSTTWKPSTGPDRYRRSLYTFSKRTAPFAAYTTFDGPSGENCIARRNRSNTPLQALTLLNDVMFLEFARSLGIRAMANAEGTLERIDWMFERLLVRPPTANERQRLLEYHDRQLQRLAARQLDATEIMSDQAARAEVAALVMVARVLMNLDEAITKY